MIKDRDEKPNEEIHGVKSGRILSQGIFVSVRLGYIILIVFVRLEAHWPLYSWDFYAGFIM